MNLTLVENLFIIIACGSAAALFAAAMVAVAEWIDNGR